MPQPRKYEDAAAKQRAYRARRQAEQLQQPATAPTYQKWRKALLQASSILQATQQDIDEWMQQRSDRWQDSERGAEMQEDCDELAGMVETIATLHIWRKGA